jgi:hypothetical protein
VSPRAAGTLRSTGGRRSPATALRSRTSSGAIRRREFGPRDLPIGGLDSAPLVHATLAGVRISSSRCESGFHAIPQLLQSFHQLVSNPPESNQISSQ